VGPEVGLGAVEYRKSLVAQPAEPALGPIGPPIQWVT
jgi:hypothetical protein